MWDQYLSKKHEMEIWSNFETEKPETTRLFLSFGAGGGGGHSGDPLLTIRLTKNGTGYKLFTYILIDTSSVDKCFLKIQKSSIL